MMSSRLARGPVGLQFRSWEVVRPNTDPKDIRWADAIHYRWSGSGDDREVLSALIEQPEYAFSYAANRDEPGIAVDPELHGPYWRAAISAERFRPMSATAARRTIDEWLYDPDSLRPRDGTPDLPPSDDPRVQLIWANSTPMYTDDVVHLNPDFALTLDRLTAGERRLYLLDDLRAEAEHDWGWVVGILGYVEVVSISDSEVSVLVCADD